MRRPVVRRLQSFASLRVASIGKESSQIHPRRGRDKLKAVTMQSIKAAQNFFREPLFRLLAVNLAVGVSAAVLLLGGLLALNPQGLRDLILGDRSPLVPAGLLLFGFVVTFGSVAMGTAIMAIGAIGRGEGGGKRKAAAVPLPVRAGRA